jgi:hypothetical protein
MMDDTIEDAKVPRLFVGIDTVSIQVDNRRITFPDAVWNAMFRYVINYRKGTVVDGTIIDGKDELPTFKWEDPKL